MALYLLVATIVIMTCALLSKVSNKLGIPMLLVFIGLGMFFGSDGVIKIPFDDFAFAEQICSIALIFIMFYGGFSTNWSEAKPVAREAILLSSLGVILTAVFTGIFCYSVLRIPLLESFLLGAVISSTDAASVFSILRSKQLNLKDHTASLLEVESGSNDPCSYMITAIMLSFLSGTASGEKIIYMIFAQVVFGLIGGFTIATLASWILKKIRFSLAGFDAIFVFAIAVLAYAAPTLVGGNGYLSTYIVGIVLGNQQIKNKKSLVNFFDGLTGLMQMLIFFLLGLLSSPSKLPSVAVPSLLIAIFLTFVARPAAVCTILGIFRCKLRQQLLVSWAGLRGAASIVFAIMVMIRPIPIENDIFHIVYGIVLFSILLQGSLIPFAAKKLDMIDSTGNVLKTFTDYTEEVPVQFIRFSIGQEHPWANTPIRKLVLPPSTLLVLIQRKNKQIAPNGDTILLAGDELILSAKAIDSIQGIHLTEISLVNQHHWINKAISEIHLEPDQLIIMIKRGERLVVPKGSTLLKEKDVLVINRTE